MDSFGAFRSHGSHEKPHFIHMKNIFFHYKPSILGFPHFRKPPYIYRYVYTCIYIYRESAVTAAKSELSHQTWIQKWSNPCSSSKHLVLLCQNFAPRNKCQLIIIWFSHVVSKELPHCSKPRNKPYPPSGCVWKCGIPKNSNFQGEVMVKPLDSGASDFWRNPSYV